MALYVKGRLSRGERFRNPENPPRRLPRRIQLKPISHNQLEGAGCKAAPPDWFVNYKPIYPGGAMDREEFHKALLAISVCGECPCVEECAEEREHIEGQSRIGLSGVWGGVLYRGESNVKRNGHYTGAKPVDLAAVRVTG